MMAGENVTMNWAYKLDVVDDGFHCQNTEFIRCEWDERLVTGPEQGLNRWDSTRRWKCGWFDRFLFPSAISMRKSDFIYYELIFHARIHSDMCVIFNSMENEI